jgi:hypothetical protein
VRGIAICPTRDAPGKRDVTAAFLPESRAFAKLHGVEHVQIDNRAPMASRGRQTLRALTAAVERTGGLLEVVAIFCHGWRDGLQLGFRAKDIPTLAGALRDLCTSDVVVALYACDAARDSDDERGDDVQDGPGGDGGFADLLRDALCREGATHCRVYAHPTTAHTTRNPHVRVFVGGGSEVGGYGGEYLVPPGSELWPTWRRALRETDLRFRFPLMSEDAVLEELGRIDVA